MINKTKSTKKTGKTQDPQTKILSLQRIYVKDISFEVPNAPDIFTQKWEPQIDVHINSSFNSLQNNMYESVLKISITAKNNSKVAFIAEVEQAGTFHIAKLTQEELARASLIACPTAIFPYARATLDSLLVKGSMPPLHLSQVNFQKLYEAKKQELLKQQASATAQNSKDIPPNKIN